MRRFYLIFVPLLFLSGCRWWTSTQDVSAPEPVEQVSIVETPLEAPVETKTVEAAPAPEPKLQEIAPQETQVVQTAAPQETQKQKTEPKQVQRRRKKRNGTPQTTQQTQRRAVKSLSEFAEYTPPQKTEPVTEKPSAIKTVAQETPAPAGARALVVHNAIDESMLKVKHWTGTYKPTKLEINVNGKVFDLVHNKVIADPGEQQTIHTDTNTITVAYNYEFMNGYRKGDGVFEYTLNGNATDLNMTFTWDNAWHVEFNNAQPIVPEEKIKKKKK